MTTNKDTIKLSLVLQKLSKEVFKRRFGVKVNTFIQILEILTEEENKKNILGARPNKLSLETRLIMWFEYLREYRTYFHIAESYNVSESTCFRNCVWIEDTLIKSKVFNLKNKNRLLNENIQLITIDATESPVERPKKTKEYGTLGRKRSIT